VPADTRHSFFPTEFLAQLEPATGGLRYVNAGHHPQFVLRVDGTIVRLPSTGLPIGLLPGQGFEPAALRAAVAADRPDMSDAVARSGVPILLFLGKNDPRYPLALSFAERSAARVMGLAEHDFQSAAGAVVQILPRILAFFDEPEQTVPNEHPPLGLWSGFWS